MKQSRIYCISPPKVNIAGKITIMCFDKTGTLTEEGLDLYGIRSVGYSEQKRVLHFQDLITNVADLARGDQTLTESAIHDLNAVSRQSIYKHTKQDANKLILEIMASCHSLTRVQGELIGDPLEIKLLEATGWIFEDNDGSKYDDLVMAVVKPGDQQSQMSENPKALYKSVSEGTMPS